MAAAAAKLPAKEQEKTPARADARPFDVLLREVEHLFDRFEGDFWRAPFRRPMFDVAPFWQREWSLTAVPAVDVAEKDQAFEVTAELLGMDEKSIEVTTVNGNLVIKGEKQEEKEEKKKDYHLSERRYGSFERRFQLPEGVDADKIAANFKNGVLTVILPKKAEAQKPEKKIDIKAA